MVEASDIQWLEHVNYVSKMTMSNLNFVVYLRASIVTCDPCPLKIKKMSILLTPPLLEQI
jgi:hypothetical protein